MNGSPEEQQDPAGQNADEKGVEENAASQREAVGIWNCEEVDRLVEEAKALALHVSRHGNSLPEGKHEPHEKLLEAIAGITSCRSAENWQELMSAYAKLTALTYKERGVNGRTILDTQAEKFKLGRLFSARNRAMGIGVIFFLSALLCEVSMRWSGKVSDEAALSGFRAVVFLIVDALSGFLVPALWGGIGSCIFLAKRTSDKLFDMAYEEARMRGGIIRTGVAPNDDSYRNSGFDRGHMAMKLLGERLGQDAAYNTHIVLNAVPQRPKFNQGIWQNLEYLTGAWAQRYHRIWVMQGPVFYEGQTLAWIGDEGERRIAVPDAVFKIVIRGKTDVEKNAAPRRDKDAPEVLAFLYPQLGPGYFGSSKDYRHERFLTTVDEIERLTGLDFRLSEDPGTEKRLERRRAAELWEPAVVNLKQPRLFLSGCRN